LNHIEIGAQEAAYILLQMPLRKATREFMFINTNVENERVVLIKPTSVLNEMPQNSTAIEPDNSLKRYQRQPFSMEKYCLAEYIAYFNISFTKSKVKKDEKEDNYWKITMTLTTLMTQYKFTRTKMIILIKFIVQKMAPSCVEERLLE
jgi:hypothetical protein